MKKNILVTQSNDEGIDSSLIVSIDSIDDLINKINNDKIFFGKGKRKESLKKVICMIVNYNKIADERDYINYNISKEQVNEAVFQSFIDGDSSTDLRFWEIKEDKQESVSG